MENKTIEALEKLVALKDETIKELERQIQLLKNQPYIPSPIQQPYVNPLIGTQTYITPFSNPITSPFYTTSGGASGATSTAILTTPNINGTSVTFNPSTTYTLTNSDGSSNVIDLKTCSRV